MTTPIVSIIVPAYNEEKNIEDTLKSLVNQSYPYFEIIVVDNNSKDKTVPIAKKYVKKVYTEKKQGYHHAVRRGVGQSKGTIITMCDADSIYPPHWLANIVHEFEENPEVLAVYGSVKFHDYNFFLNFISQVGFTFFIRLSKILGFDNTAGFNFAMKKEAYLKVGGYDPKIYDNILTDIELGRRLQKIGMLRQNPNITVYTSSRRFKEDGLLKTTLYFLDAWYHLNYKKTMKMSYDEYNMNWRKKFKSQQTVLPWFLEIRDILESGKKELDSKQKMMKKRSSKALKIAIKRLNTAISFTDSQINTISKKLGLSSQDDTQED